MKKKKHISEKDREALATLIRVYNIKSVFEIGCWEGVTTLFLYNQPNVEKVKTIDIHKDMGIGYKHCVHSLQEKKFYGKYIKDTNVEMEFCDSMKYKPKKGEQYDMVFIDGNHDYKHIKNDTELALKLNPKVIAWHDYSPESKDILIFIKELQKQVKKIKICFDTLIAFWELRK